MQKRILNLTKIYSSLGEDASFAKGMMSSCDSDSLGTLADCLVDHGCDAEAANVRVVMLLMEFLEPLKKAWKNRLTYEEVRRNAEIHMPLRSITHSEPRFGLLIPTAMTSHASQRLESQTFFRPHGEMYVNEPKWIPGCLTVEYKPSPISTFGCLYHFDLDNRWIRFQCLSGYSPETGPSNRFMFPKEDDPFRNRNMFDIARDLMDYIYSVYNRPFWIIHKRD